MAGRLGVEALWSGGVRWYNGDSRRRCERFLWLMRVSEVVNTLALHARERQFESDTRYQEEKWLLVRQLRSPARMYCGWMLVETMWGLTPLALCRACRPCLFLWLSSWGLQCLGCCLEMDASYYKRSARRERGVRRFLVCRYNALRQYWSYRGNAL
jgi:hypothetical protein